MPAYVCAVDPTETFADLVVRRELPLDRISLAIAAHAWPSLDIDEELARLDDLAARVASPSRQNLCRVLFGEVGLRGNRDDYYAPDNSFINRVLDTGLGIPISLAVVMIEVGRRAGVPIRGINAPSHFLVRNQADGAILDPFDGGVEVDDAAAATAPLAEPVGIVARMLGNLRTIYTSSGDLANLIWVLRLRTLLPGAAVSAGYELTRAQARLN